MFPLLKYWWAGCLLNRLIECRAVGGNCENMTGDQNIPLSLAVVRPSLETRDFARGFAKWVTQGTPRTDTMEKGWSGFWWFPFLSVGGGRGLLSCAFLAVVARYGFVSQLKHSQGVVDSGKCSDSNSPLGLSAEVVTELITKPQLM